MQFHLVTDIPITVVFEPTGQEHRLDAGQAVLVRWFDGDDGAVHWTDGHIVVYAPTSGYTRAWDSDGMEIDIGPESVDYTSTP
ncbi:hypothetical protein ACFCYM_21025 [Streptomyces sp. NPDC056254]|uniref:hypothetical protein n=1 Tax=Streptomyces sp. NPDC056254 TaxID=3345763 RepID=UPI0035DF7F89